MKRYLKNYVLTTNKVEEAIYDCLKNKWRRKDVSYFLAEYMMNDGDDIHDVARYCRKIAYYKSTRYLLYETITKAAESLCQEIYDEDVTLKPIEYQFRFDAASNKIREIGIASIKQQVLDYVVVNACKKMFMAKIGFYQAASIKNKGQVFGKNAIERWIRKDYGNSRYFYKCDIKKYYPNVSKAQLKRMLRRDIKEDYILYLVFALIDTYKDGLCIGSYLSQFLANYYLSYAYHHVSENSYSIRKKKDGSTIRINNSKHILFYMDDIIFFSSSLKLLKRAVADFKNYIYNTLELTIKPDDGIYKTSVTRIDMMGYSISTVNTILRKRIFVKITRAFMRALHKRNKLSLYFARRILSYNGWIKHSDLYNFKKKFKITRTLNNAKKVVKYYDKRNFYRETKYLQLLPA